eukprot:SAG31_NODE_32960_length_349_cov_1.440000_1_plen_27_part_10
MPKLTWDTWAVGGGRIVASRHAHIAGG